MFPLAAVAVRQALSFVSHYFCVWSAWDGSVEIAITDWTVGMITRRLYHNQWSPEALNRNSPAESGRRSKQQEQG